MIRYLLDTDLVSQPVKSKPNANALRWLSSVDDRALAISVITVRERREGAERAKLKKAIRAEAIAAEVKEMIAAYQGRILPIDAAVASLWAALLVPDKSRPDDKAQVAIAAVHGLTLVSLNARHMQGLGVSVLNPGRAPPKLYPA